MSNNNDNLENKPQILTVVSGNKLISGTKLKQVVPHATGNKLRRVASGNKLRQLLDSLKVSNKSSQNLPKIVGDIRHYPPANKE